LVARLTPERRSLCEQLIFACATPEQLDELLRLILDRYKGDPLNKQALRDLEAVIEARRNINDGPP
jgi:hypothetical protein